MTQADFTVALAAELCLRGVAYLFPKVAAFVADCWPLIADDPAHGHWAYRFADAGPPRTPEPSGRPARCWRWP